MRSPLSKVKISRWPSTFPSGVPDTYSNPSGRFSLTCANEENEAVTVTVNVPPGTTVAGDICLVALGVCACACNELRLSSPTKRITAPDAATNASDLLNKCLISIGLTLGFTSFPGLLVSSLRPGSDVP